MTSEIGWLWKEGYTGESWNFVTGCHKVSDGCRNCYAERIAPHYGWSKLPWTRQYAEANVTVREDRFDKPKRWKNPRMIFVNSMSDLFHYFVPDAAIARGFKVMQACPQHIFIILTKRPERAVEWRDWPANVWMGTSVEDMRVALRINTLRRCQAAIKFISFEPLIGPVGKINLTGYQWAIVGGESGPNFRPMNQAWARAIRDQCVQQRVPFFFKQSAGFKAGASPYLNEADGSKTTWQQYPGDVVADPNDQPQQLTLF